MVGLGWGLPQSARAATPVPLLAAYEGKFSLTFGTAPGGDNDLVFAGSGASLPFGLNSLSGHSTLRPTTANLLVSDIITDKVALATADGDQLILVNSGQDTLDNSDPDHLFIYGSGTFTIGAKAPGGTGKYRRAVGSGSYFVVAAVTEFRQDGSVGGTFYLVFAGTVSK